MHEITVSCHQNLIGLQRSDWLVELVSPCMNLFEILLINISTVRLSDSARQRYWTIASLYQKFIVNVHKSE